MGEASTLSESEPSSSRTGQFSISGGEGPAPQPGSQSTSMPGLEPFSSSSMPGLVTPSPSSSMPGLVTPSSSEIEPAPPLTFSFQSDPIASAAEGPRSSMPVSGSYVPPPSAPSMSFSGASESELIYASNTIGDGNQNIPLGIPLERSRFADTQPNAIYNFNYNNALRASKLASTLVPVPQMPGQVSFEEMQAIQQKREYAQLQQHVEQERRDNMYMRMNQMQEQARNKGWMDYHYGKELM